MEPISPFTKSLRPVLVVGVLALFAYTASHEFLAVPPVHFDEAWFGQFAVRILREKGYWPWEAMNSYTSAILHYLLAGAFFVLGPSTSASRIFFLGMNVVNFALLTTWLHRFRGFGAACVGAVFYSILPIAIFDSRIQLEVTTWFAFCYLLVLWGLLLWRSRPAAASFLIVAASLCGISSHILFFVVYFSIYWLAFWRFRSEFTSRTGQVTSALACGLAIALPIRMGLQLHDVFPFLIAGAFALMVALPFLPRWLPLPYGPVHVWASRVIALAAVAPALIYLVLLFDGAWPYAQVTGVLQYVLVPANLLVLIAFWVCTRNGEERFRSAWLELLALQMFVNGFAVLKPTSAKYWMIPTLTLILGLGVMGGELAKKRPRVLAASLVLVLGWNLFLFQHTFIDRFLEHGATRDTFRLWRFHDEATYYRPVGNLYAWLRERGCQDNPVVFDFGRQEELYRHFLFMDAAHQGSASKPGACALGPKSFYVGAARSVPEGYSLLERNPRWGDLELWAK